MENIQSAVPHDLGFLSSNNREEIIQDAGYVRYERNNYNKYTEYWAY